MLVPALARLALVLAACGCALAPVRSVPAGAQETRKAPLLPPATAPLSIDLEQGKGLLPVLEALAAATGQHLLMDAQTEQRVRAQAPRLVGGPVEVPAEEAYAFVESLLLHERLVVARVKGGDRPILGVYASGPALQFAPRVHVTLEEVPLLAEHPALLARTVVTLPNLDVRQLSTSLRALLTDASVQTLMPLGESSLLIGSTGADLARIVATLEELDRVAGERRRAAPDGRAAPGDAPSTPAGPPPDRQGAR